MALALNGVLLLVILAFTTSLKLEGSGHFFCPKKTVNDMYQCKKSADILLSGDFNSDCTKLGLAKNVSVALKTASPGCHFIYLVLDKPGEENPQTYGITQLATNISCPSDLASVEIHDQCVRQLTAQERDLFDMCKTFGTIDDFDECRCDAFRIIRGDETIDLCRIAQKTKDREPEYKTLKIKEPNSRFKTVLQRSCLYFNKTGGENCHCADLKVSNGTLKTDFCEDKKKDGQKKKDYVEGFEEACRYFNFTMDNCDCNLFNFSDQTTKESFCDFINPTPVINLKHKNYFHLPYATIETVASAIGIVGNLIVIAVAIRFRIGLAPCKWLIANLAVCDLYFAVFQITYAIPKFWTAQFIYGRFICKVMRSTEYLGVLLAVGVILTISVERFIGIVNPFSRGISKKGLNGILFLNAFCGLLACIPLFYYSEVNDIGICEEHWPNGNRDMFIYNLFILIVYLLIPTIVIATLYSIIVSTLYGTMVLGNNSIIADPRLRQKRLQDNRRTMYVLIGVVIAFILFVFPKHIIMTYTSHKGYGWGSKASQRDMSTSTFMILEYICHFSYPFHVSINPIVYSLVDARWRKDVRHFFTGHSWRNRSAYSATMTSTMTQRRRSSVATVLDEPCSKKRSPPTATKLNPINNNNNSSICRPRQLVVTTTTNGKFDTSALPTPLTSSADDLWMKENNSGDSKFTFIT